jgi:hypothetical protein
MNPNPFDNADRKVSDPLYRTVAREFFVSALKSQGFTDVKRADAAFDDLQLDRTQKFAECEGYASRMQVKKGYMSVVRMLTPAEVKHEVPEAFNPRLLKSTSENGKNKP